MSLSAEQITEKYYSDVYKFCCSRCRNADAAQYITQDTFLLFVDKFDELTEKNIRSWLFTVANNKLHDYFREQKIENNFVCVDDVKIPSFDDYENENIDIDAIFDDVQKKILNLLNDKERDIFIKLYIEKKSPDLIVNELNITYENYRTRKSRLQRKVKNSIGHLYFFALVCSFKIFR